MQSRRQVPQAQSISMRSSSSSVVSFVEISRLTSSRDIEFGVQSISPTGASLIDFNASYNLLLARIVKEIKESENITSNLCLFAAGSSLLFIQSFTSSCSHWNFLCLLISPNTVKIPTFSNQYDKSH